MKTKKPIVWFEEVGKDDITLVGGKGANLGEMLKAGFRVPPGFIVTADSYFHFLEDAQIQDQIAALLSSLDPHDSNKLHEVATQIKGLISDAKMPEDIAEEIRQAYRKLGDSLVAVRSSATAEDMPEASFAGQQRTFLNVFGENHVVKAVQQCWASLFEPRAIFYRAEQGFDHLMVGIAVPVQRMVQSEASGIMFTMEPVTNDGSKIAIEAVYGLGEAAVSGELTPDLYVLDKSNLRILNKAVTRQEWMLVRNVDGPTDYQMANMHRPVAKEKQTYQKLTDEEILDLADIGRRLEEYYNLPQDVEWARQDGVFYIVQSRPITTGKEKEGVEGAVEVGAKAILSGSPASPGVGSGPAVVIHSTREINKVNKGDILVTEMTTPDFVPAMKRAAAIVTDRGGRTCHAAIVSRELGVPCVVGTENATKTLSNGQVVTVDGSKGKVYEGRVAIKKETQEYSRRNYTTLTKVYVNLAEPELADVVATQRVNGVGLLRAEFIIAHIGEHPRYMLGQNREHEFIEKLAKGLETFVKAFHPRPVVYRTTDFKTNEYRNLKGGEAYEMPEENPMIGYRGCSRYISELDVFRLETEAIKRVRKKYTNLWVMLPFVRTPEELAKVKQALESEGLSRSKDFKLWMMVEVPSNVILMDKFIDVGIDGISIGSNDLTQLTLGIDRDNEKLAEIFDERNEAVLWGLEMAIKTAVKRGITSSICGQAPSFYPDLTAKLVEWGITSVSVSPDAIDRTRDIIAQVEERLGKLPPQN